MGNRKGCTERVQRCYARMLTLPEICPERIRYYTESYRATEGELPVSRQSKAFENMLAKMTVKIAEGELIVGYASSKERGGAVLPELNAGWLNAEIDEMSVRAWDTFKAPSPAEREEILSLLRYWEGKSAYEMWEKRVPQPVMELYRSGFVGGVTFSNNGFYPGHHAVDYEKVLRHGLRALCAEAEARLAELNLDLLENVEKYHFYQAVIRSLRAVRGFAQRYADLAADMARREPDAVRRGELERIAAVCARVPWEPAENFWEAVQSTYFLWLTMMVEGWGHGLTLARPDQYLYPFYAQDIRSGAITQEQALEFVELFFVKLNTTVTIDDYATATCFAGFPQACDVTVGGVDADGRDAANELTFLLFEAERDVGSTAEDLVIRVSPVSSERYLLEAVELAKALKGKLKFVSDPVAFSQFRADGYPETLLWNYAVTGCNSPCLVGASLDLPGGLFNLPMLLEFALNDGKSRLTGAQVGPRTGDPRRFRSYEEVWEAFCRQVDFFTGKVVVMMNADRAIFAENLPIPYQSALMDGPIERGRDLFSGGTGLLARESYSLSGAPNVGDSLAALKKVVFEDGTLTMEQVIHALDVDFAGCEREWKLLADAPKFGNDEPYVDEIVNRVLVYAADAAAKYRSYCGTPVNVAAATISSNVPMGALVGALPDGRRAGTPISEGGISPHQGRNVSGPTATLNSVANVPHERLTNGAVLNMRFSPSALDTPEKMKKFAQLTRAYLLSGGFFVQYNILDTETLRDAQRHPERYRDLLVRVATYSAYFVELSPDMQNDIIARMEFTGL